MEKRGKQGLRRRQEKNGEIELYSNSSLFCSANNTKHVQNESYALITACKSEQWDTVSWHWYVQYIKIRFTRADILSLCSPSRQLHVLFLTQWTPFKKTPQKRISINEQIPSDFQTSYWLCEECCGLQWSSVINTRSPTVHCANGVKWYIHFPSRKWVVSRLPWTHLGITIPPPPQKVLVTSCEWIKTDGFCVSWYLFDVGFYF